MVRVGGGSSPFRYLWLHRGREAIWIAAGQHSVVFDRLFLLCVGWQQCTDGWKHIGDNVGNGGWRKTSMGEVLVGMVTGNGKGKKTQNDFFGFYAFLFYFTAFGK